jgi:hypothetical protein
LAPGLGDHDPCFDWYLTRKVSIRIQHLPSDVAEKDALADWILAFEKLDPEARAKILVKIKASSR